MPKTDLLSLTPDSLRELMRQAGYRAAIVKGPDEAPLLCSATSGLPFEARFLNPAPGEAKGYADVMLTAGLQVQGDLPLDLVNRWNSTKRFARIYIGQSHLILAMDIVMLGGVSREHLVAQIELWDRLLQELVPYLRSAASEVAAMNGAVKPSTVLEPEGDRATATAA